MTDKGAPAEAKAPVEDAQLDTEGEMIIRKDFLIGKLQMIFSFTDHIDMEFLRKTELELNMKSSIALIHLNIT